ncbi:MAG: hypothetical protein PHT60_08730 [Acidiphilium sp.]|nr:hypothetical protein [Acidiphilium sp.]MDD4935846.1 hypothetical protein [Acidiphilium sp.]
MKPILRKGLVLVAAGVAAIGLSGCVYYPSGYGYGYGYGYPAYVAPAPVVTGSVVIGGGYWGGWGRGWGGGYGGWGGDHDGWGGRH